MLPTAPLFCFPLPVLGLDNPSPSPGSHLPVLLRKAFNSRHQAFCLQALGTVGLARVPVALLRSPAGQIPCSAFLSLWLDGSLCFPAKQACSLRWEQRGASWSPKASWPQGTSHGDHMSPVPNAGPVWRCCSCHQLSRQLSFCSSVSEGRGIISIASFPTLSCP